MKKELKFVPFEPYYNISNYGKIFPQLKWSIENLKIGIINLINFVHRNYFYELDNLEDLYKNVKEFKNKVFPIAHIANVAVQHIEDTKKNFEYKITVFDVYGKLELNAVKEQENIDSPFLSPRLNEDEWKIVTSLKPLDDIEIYFDPRLLYGKTNLYHIAKHDKRKKDDNIGEYSGLDEILKKSKIIIKK